MSAHEDIKISEHIRIETALDASIYLEEFVRHRIKYFQSKADSELVFTFIFLQIYIECFLHQNMRRIIDFEFKPPRNNIQLQWANAETLNIREKVDNFITLFFAPVPQQVQSVGGIIKNHFKQINDMRNLFAHGHKVATWSDSDGNSGSSTAKLLLTEAQLAQSVFKVNELGVAWNALLDAVLLQCKALRGVEDFKFPTL